MRGRIENEIFFASPERPAAAPIVAERVFYAGRPRPPLEIPVAVRAAATPMRFALVIFLVGWAGIFFQASILQQIVFGAPVFEELAKLGPALIIAILLGARSLWIRMPLALASGAAFGVMEHYVTYVEEPMYSYVGRIAFHAIAPALSMLVYGALESYPDVRARWAATIPATLFHWANNFAAIVLGLASLFIPYDLNTVGLVWGATVTVGMAVATIAAMFTRARFELGARRALEAAMPKLGFVPVAAVEEERRVENVEPL